MSPEAVAWLGDQEIWLDDLPEEGERIDVREDADDMESPIVGTGWLHHDGDRWLLLLEPSEASE
jgi:hypothetical protein